MSQERYNVTAAREFAHRIKALGFQVYLAEREAIAREGMQ